MVWLLPNVAALETLLELSLSLVKKQISHHLATVHSQWIQENIALLHCFCHLLMKMPPTVIKAGNLFTTAPQICSELIMTMKQQKRKEKGGF